MKTAGTKVCKDCGEEKPLTDFPHVTSRGSLIPDARCRPCYRARARAYYAANREHIRSVRRARISAKRDLIIEQNNAASARWIKNNPDKARKNCLDYQKRNPDKVACWRAYAKALKQGLLIRPAACSRCAKPCKPDGHHHDYSKPLAVEWLCRRCHGSVRHIIQTGH